MKNSDIWRHLKKKYNTSSVQTQILFFFLFLDAIHSSLQAILVLMITQFMVLDRQSFHMATINQLCT